MALPAKGTEEIEFETLRGASLPERETKKPFEKKTTGRGSSLRTVDGKSATMDSRHASLGRRTLEEIRQKRAVERLSKAPSGPDLTKVSGPNDTVGMKKSESGNRLSEVKSICTISFHV